jgi:hypothetical protein
MKKQWQEFLFENAKELASLVARLEEALDVGNVEGAKDCLTTLWVKHGITLDDDGNLHHVISFDFVNDRVRLKGGIK